MGTTRLDLYNKALLACGERFLATLAEDREPRRLLDHVWDTGGVDYCLEQGAWQFAMRTGRIEVDPSFTPDFGYRNAFEKPEDWVSTWGVCSDEYFRTPLNEYADEVGHWFADIEPIYVQFVSNDATYGADLSKWPASFADYVGNYFASKIVGKLGGDKSEQLRALLGPPGAPERGALQISLHKAKSLAARTQPARFPAEGSWTIARRGRTRRDGGNRGSLIG